MNNIHTFQVNFDIKELKNIILANFIGFQIINLFKFTLIPKNIKITIKKICSKKFKFLF